MSERSHYFLGRRSYSLIESLDTLVIFSGLRSVRRIYIRTSRVALSAWHCALVIGEVDKFFLDSNWLGRGYGVVGAWGVWCVCWGLLR